MVKRVITKISLSTFVLATGLFLWSNLEQANATQLANAQDNLCIPVGPAWPECTQKKEEDKN